MWNIKPPLPDHRMNPFPRQNMGVLNTVVRRGSFGMLQPQVQRPDIRSNIRIWR